MNVALQTPVSWLSIVFSLLLAGCWGGSGGGSAEGAPVSSSKLTTTALTGAATKGTMQFAQMIAYELDGGGRRLKEVGRTETDANGDYELQLTEEYENGMLEVVASVVDDRTQMICDASRCGDKLSGQTIALPQDFSMSALAPGGESVATSVSTTTWTSMATERARHLVTQGHSLEAAAAQAEAEISELVGFSLARTRALALLQISAASGAEHQYAVLNAAAAELLFSDGGFSTERFHQFTRAMNDGVLNASDAFGPGQLSRAVGAVIHRTPQLDHQALARLHNLVGRLDALPEEGFTPTFDPSLLLRDGATSADKIAAFQRFVSPVRTWIGAVSEIEANAFEQFAGVDSDAIAKFVGEDSQAQLRLVADILDQSNGYIARDIDNLKELFDGGETRFDYLSSTGEAIGYVTLRFSNSEHFEISLDGALLGTDNSVFLPFSLRLSTGISTEAMRLASRESYPQLLSSGTLRLSASIENPQQGSALLLNEVSLSLGSQKAVAAAVKPEVLGMMNIRGDIVIRSEGASFRGMADLVLARLNKGGKQPDGRILSPVVLRSFKLGGEFVAQDGSVASSMVSVDLYNAPQIDLISWLDKRGEKHLIEAALRAEDIDFFANRLFPDTGVLDELQIYAELESGTASHLRARGYSAGNGTAEFEACLENARATLAAWGQEGLLDSYGETKACAEATLIPSVVELQGDLGAEYSARLQGAVQELLAQSFGADMELASGLLLKRIWIELQSELGKSGRLGVEFRLPKFRETEHNFLEAAFTVSTRVSIPDLHSAQLTATVHRSSYRGGSLVVNVANGRHSYSLSLSSDDFRNPERVDLRFFDAQGYALNMEIILQHGELQDIRGKAMIGREQIGAVELRRGSLPFIVYPDGDETVIESLL